jgi:SAM-dependent methyltransferase
MEQLGEPYETLMCPHVHSAAPQVAFYSSVSGELITKPGELGPSYWRRNMEQPVLFSTAVSTILSQEETPGETLFLELGPHSTLAGPLRQIFKSRKAASDPVYVPTLIRNQDQVVNLMTAAGSLYQNGVTIDFAAINGPGEVLTNLPNYSWQHDAKYWSESRVTRGWRLRQFPHHELLGSRMLESTDMEPAWRNNLRPEDVPWLIDHKIIEDVVFPCAAYIATAGEAIRQITGSRDYTLRQLSVKTALVLREQESTELVTSIRQVRLTDSLDSSWYEFTISSFNGSAWVKHCVGQARPASIRAQQDKNIEPFPRQVESAHWYLAMKKLGLNYGPRFQGLQDISAHPKANRAAASLYDDRAMHESTYTLHPTIIDQSLQLFTVAISGGIPRRLGKLAVPASIGEIYVSDGGPNMSVEVDATVTAKGALHGKATIMSGDSVAMSLYDGVFAPLENESHGDQDSVAAARLDWKPDIDFIPPKDLIHPKGSKRQSMLLVEKLGLMCLIESKHRLQSLATEFSHLKQFKQWIDTQTSRIAEGTLKIIPEAQSWVSADAVNRKAQLEEIIAQVDDTEGAPVGAILQRILDNLDDIFQGKVDPLEVLMEDNGLTNLYAFYQDMWDCSAFFSLLGHAKPTLKILEIGAGTGGTTAGVLEDLKSAGGMRLYSQYSFTDISAGFFVTAKDRFKQYEGVEYSVLDITKDPAEQGFELGSYDLVLATNVLHATPHLQATLENVRKLLAPGGRLFLQELCPELRWIGYIMGILPGWWLGGDDQRSDEPFVSSSRWDEELRQAGFSGLEGAIVLDDDAPYQLNATMVAAVAPAILPEKKVTLLHGYDYTIQVRDVEQQFIQSGYTVDRCTLRQVIPKNQDVVALLDLNEPFFDNISDEALSAFQDYLSMAQTVGTLWVTKSSHLTCNDPRYGLVLGMARTVRSELSQDFATLEMDNFDAAAYGALVGVYEKFQRRQKDDILSPEYEYALCDGVVHTSRYHWVSATDHLSTVAEQDAPRKLQIGKLGLLDTLFWATSETGDLKNDEVEVAVSCVGLNFKVRLMPLSRCSKLISSRTYLSLWAL